MSGLNDLLEELRQGAIDLDGMYAWADTMRLASSVLIAERNKAVQAEGLAENWRNDSREETEAHLEWEARALAAEKQLHEAAAASATTVLRGLADAIRAGDTALDIKLGHIPGIIQAIEEANPYRSEA
jgi:microcystin degradation protein MlrC